MCKVCEGISLCFIVRLHAPATPGKDERFAEDKEYNFSRYISFWKNLSLFFLYIFYRTKKD